MTGEAVVDFYYGIASRYSYLASTQIARLEEETGCRVRWLPICSTNLIRHGGDPFDGSVISGQYDWRYRRHDSECWAAYYGIPYNEPNFDDYDPDELALACIAAERLDAVVPYSQGMFHAVFVQGGVIDVGRYADIAVAAGLARPAFEAAIADPSIGEAHDARVEEAHRRGAFGVPTFFVGERMFWGNDRLPLLRHYLLHP